jgi:DNA-binding MarR family transcriptional regulator
MSTPEDLGAMIGYKLKQAQSVLRARMDATLREVGLTTSQYVCLELLQRAPGASHSDLARDAFVTRQSMNTLLQGLMERGLVERDLGTARGRAVPMVLTQVGADLLEDAAVRVLAVEGRLVSGLSAQQRRDLHDALDRCIAGLDD